MLKTKRDCEKFTVPEGKDKAKAIIFSNGLPGLVLVARRTKSGISKSIRFILRGVDVTLGTWAMNQDLEKVREWHRQQHERHTRGQTPQKTLTTVPPTMQALFDEWLVVKCPEPSRPGRKSIWKNHAKPLHRIDPAQLTYQDVYRLLLKLGVSNAAHRVTQTVKSMMLYGFQNYGFGGKQPVYVPVKLAEVHNPKAVNTLISHKRDVILPLDQFRDLWHRLNTDNAAHAVIAVLMATGARKSEVTGLDWSEIIGNIWTLPAERSKSRKAFARPLPPFIMAIIDQWRWTVQHDEHGNPHGLVFGYVGASTVNHSLQRLLGDGVQVTVHDLRRSFAHNASTHAGLDPLVADLLIGHTPPARLLTTYQPEAFTSQIPGGWEIMHNWFASTIL